MGADGQGIDVQIKNYEDAEVNRQYINDPKYDGHQKVVPEGQVIDDGHTDRIQAFEAESLPLKEPASRDLVKQLREVGRRRPRAIRPDGCRQSAMGGRIREATTAGTRAAILGAVLQTCPYLLAIAKRTWVTGELSAKDFAPLARALPTTLIQSGLAGGLSAAVVGAVRKGVLGSTRQVHPTVVAAAVVLAMGAFRTSVKAARGEVTWPLAAKRISEDAILLAAAMGRRYRWPSAHPDTRLGSTGREHCRRRVGQPCHR